MPTEAAHVNQDFYEQVPEGRRDYWRKMAACRHRVQTLLAELRRHRPQSVIDLGCGDGALLDEVAATLPRTALTGIDISNNQIEINRRLRPGVNWHRCDLDGPFVLPSTTADALVASEVIEHLDNPDEFLRSALALAAPGCRLYLTTQSGPLRETERRVGHRRHYTSSELSQMLGATGWTPEHIWNTGYPFHDLSKWYANVNPDRSLAEYGTVAYGIRQNAMCWALRLLFRLNSRRRGAQLFAVAIR